MLKTKLSITILTLATSILLSNILNQTANAYSSGIGEETIVYEVEYGDTLWSIADEFTEDDPRDKVVEIMKINKLRGDLIKPGQLLKIMR